MTRTVAAILTKRKERDPRKAALDAVGSKRDVWRAFREGVQCIYWDMGFLVWGATMLILS